jgi:cytochrome c oxidase subunit 1
MAHDLPDTPLLDQQVARRTSAWIVLGVYALLAAGILSLLLALARTPGIQNILPGKDFFHIALVVHVDLSVLVWFMACAGMVWTLFGPRRGSVFSTLAFGLAVLGTLMISIAPFVGADQPLMNNYVPVLQHDWFFLGLAALAAGMVLQALTFLWHTKISFINPTYTDLSRFALALAAVTVLMAVAAVGWVYLRIPDDVTGEAYFEVLFWGGGHILQFTNCVLVLLAWILHLSLCSWLRSLPVN